MNSIARVADVSPNTVAKLLEEAGKACEAFHDRTVRNVHSRRVQCDEIWSFGYAKQKNVETAKAAPEGSGDLWTWTALDADSKLIISYLCGGRDAGYANEFLADVASRLATRVQLTTDGHKAYLDAVEASFGADIDYANWSSCMAMRPAQRGATALQTAPASRRPGSKAVPTGIMSARPTWNGRT